MQLCLLFGLLMEAVLHLIAFNKLHFGYYCNILEFVFLTLNTVFIGWGLAVARLGVEQFAGFIRVLTVLEFLCKLKQMQNRLLARQAHCFLK